HPRTSRLFHGSRRFLRQQFSVRAGSQRRPDEISRLLRHAQHQELHRRQPQASKELEMMPTTEGALDLKLDLTHVIDGFHGNEHTLPITPLYNDVLQIFA